ncbi:MAG: DUF2911 domain-containing protein [Chitinophagaceae bacterium]|jgi:hypothetical protein|nr:DUF2911 domain-containing protein [Chitinophagaceae bacterium]
MDKMLVFNRMIVIVTITFFVWSCNNQSNTKKNPPATHDANHHSSSLSGYADSVNNGLIEKDTMKSSPKRTTMATIGKTHIHINYHSPGVKNRIIWGGLVPYNTVWVTGAHTATSIQINNAIEINDKRIEAGTYAIFTIPQEKDWIFILNKNYQQHLTDSYTEADDVMRVAVKPLKNTLTPRLTYTIEQETNNAGRISILWEKIKVTIPFKVL